MKIPRSPHPWKVSPREGIAIQKKLATQIIPTFSGTQPTLVAGLDAAFSPDGTQCIAGVVIWDCANKIVVEEQTALRPVQMPYIPGLLSFREAPALLAVLRKLKTVPDVLMCDGHGIATPRRFGIACHVGFICDMPSLGCGKSLYVGEHKEPAARRGSATALTHKDALIGKAVRTRDGVNLVYISPGHRMDVDTAVNIALRCGNGYRIPEPTRLADQLVARVKKTMK